MTDSPSGNGVTHKPVKSPSDTKQYRIIRLDNGLRAVLVSDLSSNYGVKDDADAVTYEGSDDVEFDEEMEDLLGVLIEEETNVRNKRDHSKREEKLAAAALCINVGSFSDPDDIPGLAHLLEHMVFLGSSKYPNENSFPAFMQRYGGFFNAATGVEKTIFNLDIQTKHFRKALDYFAQFFICSLLNPESMEREIEAVDSEFQLDLSSDTCRSQQLFRSLSKNGQPVKKFMWGNRETLRTKPLERNIDVHSRLKEFYHRYYLAHYMTLAVQSQETLDTLESWVREIFSHIPNSNLPAPNFNEFSEPFDTPEFYKLYKIIPVKNIHQLQLTWILPCLINYYRVNPHLYLSWLIRHEGEGSILSYLKSKTWALGLGCSVAGNEMNSMVTCFTIVVNLTEDGLNHMFEVITVIYEYIEMVRRMGPQERIFEEIQTIGRNDFRWQGEMHSLDNVLMLCVNMQLYPNEYIITGGLLLFDFDSKVIADIQKTLLPEKCNIMILSQNFGKEQSTKMRERWFQTPYFVQDVDPEWLAKWKQLEINPHLHLPDVNKFVPNNFDIKDPDLPLTEYPVKILDDDQCRLWYKKDTKFKTPKAHVYFNLITPVVNYSPQNLVLSSLFIDILALNLSEIEYPASVAGLYCSLERNARGLSIKVAGYNDKLPIFFESIFHHIDNFTVKDELFEAVKNRTLRKYYNYFIRPGLLCIDILAMILRFTHWTALDKHAADRDVNKEMLLNFVKTFKCKLFIEGLIQGNVTGKEALEMMKLVQSKLKCTQIQQNQFPERRVMQLNEGEKYCRVNSFNLVDGNSVITNYYQSEPGNIRKNCLQDLLVLLMEEPCFTSLRTQQQLGYDVEVMFQNTSGILGFTITVHSQVDKFSCAQVDERIEAFLRDFLMNLETKVSEIEFKTYVTSLIRLKKCVDLQLGEEVDRNWDEINYRTYVFDRVKLDVEHLSKITFSEFREHYKFEELFGSGKKLRKLGIQVVGAGKVQDGRKQIAQRRLSCTRSLSESSSEKSVRTLSMSDLVKARSKSRDSSGVDLELPDQNDQKEYKLQFAPDVGDNSLFINDIHNFKNGLMVYPVTKIIN